MKNLKRFNTFIVYLSIFILGVIWQKYYGINDLLIKVGIRDIEYSDFSDREVYSKPLKNPLIIMIAGQSNAANSVSIKSSTSLPILNFFNGKLYRAKDPLLGATDKRGSLWIKTAEQVIQNSKYEEVIIVNVAKSNSSIFDWNNSSYNFHYLSSIYQALEYADLSPQLFLWVHGERDSIDKLNKNTYYEMLNHFFIRLKMLHKNKDILISLSSRCYDTQPNESIRSAQKKIILSSPSIHIGVDTDAFGNEFRFDGCHYNSLGLKHISNEWAKSIIKIIKFN